MADIELIKKIRRKVRWRQKDSEDDATDGDCPYINADLINDAWSPYLVDKIFSYVEATYNKKNVLYTIQLLKEMDAEYDEFDLDEFSMITTVNIVEDWDKTYCEKLGYSIDDKLMSFVDFLYNECKPKYRKTPDENKLVNHINNKFETFMTAITDADYCSVTDSDEYTIWHCDTLFNKDVITFDDFWIFIGSLNDIDNSRTSQPTISIKINAIFNLIGGVNADFRKLIGYDKNSKKFYYPVLSLFSNLLTIQIDVAKAAQGENINNAKLFKSMVVRAEPDYKTLGFGSPGDEDIDRAIYDRLVNYKEIKALTLGGDNDPVNDTIDKKIRLKLKREVLVKHSDFKKIIKETIKGRESSKEFAREKSIEVQCLITKSQNVAPDAVIENEGLLRVIENLVVEIEEKINEDIQYKNAIAPKGRGSLSSSGGYSSSSSGKSSKNVPEFCKIEWPSSKNSSASSHSKLTTNAQKNAWAWLISFLPRSAKITSGTRSTMYQIKLIIAAAKKHSVELDEKVTKYYDVNNGNNINEGDVPPEISTLLKRICASLKSKDYHIAFPSDHMIGAAFDIGTNEIPRVDNIISTIINEVPQLRMTTLREPNNGSGAVHVSIQNSISVDRDKIDAIWKKIEDCKKSNS